MDLTAHAEVRKQQRGFQADDIDLIVTFGTPIKRPGNTIEYRMRKKDGKRLIQRLDKILDKAVLVSEDDAVVTVYNIEKNRKT